MHAHTAHALRRSIHLQCKHPHAHKLLLISAQPVRFGLFGAPSIGEDYVQGFGPRVTIMRRTECCCLLCMPLHFKERAKTRGYCYIAPTKKGAGEIKSFMKHIKRVCWKLTRRLSCTWTCYFIFSLFWSLGFFSRRISGNQLRYISGHALQGLQNLKVL